jgi:hypothetical protein
LLSCLSLVKDRRLTKLSPPGLKYKAWSAQLAFGCTKSEAKAKVAQQSPCVGEVKKPHYLSIKSRVQGKSA